MNAKYKEILEKAYRSFAMKGYEKTSLGDIAKEVNISKPAIYYYFKSKEELFVKLYESVIYHLDNAIKKDYDYTDKLSFIDAVIKNEIQEIEALKEDKYLNTALKQFYLLGLRNKKIADLSEKLLELNEQRFHNVLKNALNLGLINEDEKEDLASLLSMVDASITERIAIDREYDYKSLWKTFVTRIFERE